jgi:hypothetical protein
MGSGGRGAACAGKRRGGAVGAFGGGLRRVAGTLWHACGRRGGRFRRGHARAAAAGSRVQAMVGAREDKRGRKGWRGAALGKLGQAGSLPGQLALPSSLKH